MADNDSGAEAPDASADDKTDDKTDDKSAEALTLEDLALLDDDDDKTDDTANQDKTGAEDATGDDKAGDDKTGAAEDKAGDDKSGDDKSTKAAADDKTGEDFDWRTLITDEAAAKAASRYTSLNDLAKGVNDWRTEANSRIKLLGKDASEEDVAKFRKAFGVPENAESYTVEAPKGVELSELDEEIINLVKPLAFKGNIPQQTFQDFMSGVLELNEELRKNMESDLKAYADESEATLKKEWGKEYDANKNLAKRFVEVWGGDDLSQFLNQTKLSDGGVVGDHPAMVRLFATLGKRSDEGDLMLGATDEEKASAQTELDELNAKVPVGSKEYMSDAHQQKLQAIYRRLDGGDQAIVGSQGRAA